MVAAGTRGDKFWQSLTQISGKWSLCLDLKLIMFRAEFFFSSPLYDFLFNKGTFGGASWKQTGIWQLLLMPRVHEDFVLNRFEMSKVLHIRSLQGCQLSWKQQLACLALPLILLSILALIWHLTNRRSGYCGSCRCFMDSAASCGRPGLLSEETSFSDNNGPNIDFISWILLP